MPKKPNRKKPARRKTVKYTRREKKFLELLHQGFNLRHAALGAGYSPNAPDRSAQQAKAQIERKGGFDVYEALGLTRDQFIKEHVAPGLKATETKVFMYEGEPVYSKPLVAWGPRQRAQDMVLLIAGDYKREQENTAPGVRVVIIDRANRPHRENGNAKPALDVRIPSLAEGNQEEPKK